MELLKVELPKNITIGKKALENIGKICSDLRLKGSVSVFTDDVVMELAGKKVLEILASHDYKAKEFILPPKVRLEDVKTVDSDFILGLGGGKVIDFAKMTAKISSRPFISVPTAISHDGIASDRAVIGDSYSIPAVMSTAIVIDTDIIANSPYRLTAAGAGDMIAKLTAIADWRLSNERTGEYISEYAANINRTAAKLIINEAKLIKKGDQKGLRTLIEALVFSGISMSIAGSSRPASGCEHMFSHYLKVLYPQKTSLHGEECALASVVYSQFHGIDWKKTKKAIETIGLPKTSAELGLPKDVFIRAICDAKKVRSDRYTILDAKKIDEKTAEMAAKEAGIVE